MTRAPILLAAVVLLWGWQCGFLAYAMAMAVLLEAPRLVRARWDLSELNFQRISDLSALLLAGVTVYQFDRHGFHAIFPILKVVPMVLFPLALAQCWSTRDRISYAALFLSVRRAVRRGRIRTVGSVDVTYAFFLACLIAASAGGSEGQFLVALAVLSAWALAIHRPRGRRLALWAGAVGAAFAVAYGAQMGMVALRGAIEPIMLEWFQEGLWSRRDPYRAQTAIGHLGRMKVSQRIVARVTPAPGTGSASRPGPGPVSELPPLLRQAAYSTYSRHMWLAPGVQFLEIPAEGGGTTWRLYDKPAPARIGQVRVTSSLHRGRGVLLLPPGSFRVEGLNVETVRRNRLGAVRVDSGPSLIDYAVRFGEEETFVDTPRPADLEIPEREGRLFGALAGRLGIAPEALAGGLEGRPAREVVERVEAYFADGFTYWLGGRRTSFFSTPLEDFLEKTRRGHCEYFATATVLLLRAAGVPARYTTGYALQEWSPLEGAYVVRRRHAHAWASAFVDGAWRDVDTTPGVWFEAESAAEPWWVGGYDVLSWLRFRFDRWRQQDTELVSPEVLIGLAGFLAAVLMFRLARSTRVVRAARGRGAERAWPGQDSELYLIVPRIRERHGPPRPGETLRAWLERLHRRGRLPRGESLVDEILPMHYRLRFDPAGLGSAERERLRHLVRQWLAESG